MEPIVNVPIGDYDALRDRVRELEAENVRLKECCEHLCEENKVMVIERKMPCDIEYSANSLLLNEYCHKVHTELKHLGEVKDEVVSELVKRIERLKEANKSLGENTESQFEANKAICKKAQELEDEIERLKKRNWWQRLWNK